MDKVKEEMGLPMIQKTLLIWDAFRCQQSQLITNNIDYYNIVTVLVPNNLQRFVQKDGKSCLQ